MSLATLSYDSGAQSQPGTDLWEKLELTSKDPCRTRVVHANDPQKIVYRASTTNESGSKPVTTYTDASDNVIATLEWHLHLSDKLSVRGGEKQNVGKWLKSKGWRKGRGASFTDENGHTYSWGSVEGGPSLHLFADDDASVPIAMFTPPGKGKTFNDPEARPATILCSERAKQVRDEIAVSVLLLEKARRFSRRGSVFSSESAMLGLAASAPAFSMAS